MQELNKGYHVEQSGRGYDLLIREKDNKIIAKYEGDYYNDIEDMTTPAYYSADCEALESLADYVGF